MSRMKVWKKVDEMVRWSNIKAHSSKEDHLVPSEDWDPSGPWNG